MKLLRILFISLAIILAAIAFFVPMASAQTVMRTITLLAGDVLTVTCPSAPTTTAQGNGVTVTCPSLVPTSTPTPRPTATTAPTVTPLPSPTHDMTSMGWHAPGGHGGIPAHDHGDPPPAWVTAAGYTPAFDHPANTPNENALPHKHSAMKGWAGRFNGVDWFGIFHLDNNMGGYASRFHSYQLWLKRAQDPGTPNTVSHMTGWIDFGEGNATGPNLVVSCVANSGVRPQIFPMQAKNCPFHYENWYGAAAGSGEWAPDFGFNLEPNYVLGGDAADPSTWIPIDGNVHLTRRIEFAWYANRSDLRGKFWTTQWGDLVDGPTDPLCDGLHTRTFGTKTYTVLCLEQTIQPSLPSVVFPGNAVQRTFAGGSGVNRVQLPN